ncbi:DEAD/DEAH box helicase [Thiomicrospira sp. ALE5]|uniref:DEAD/DEAH box helicase n=1 Tax=Thiomicrospira sp. ALE5 TaxID=748650 RepID=UPI0008F40E33|nr:DEAD/DEAH box helicase [Thiomicrospira sp. ALE5]SFR54809.1 ATP-dependent RNA helicase SrmB [Thiomicrospira sp. ALE5]
MNFADFDLDDRLLEALREVHFNRPTPIQQQAIPALMAGKDVLAGAATGTGKTAAFVLPVLQHIIDNPQSYSPNPRALLLAPTRELALQIRQVVKSLSRHLDLRSVAITGGLAQDKQRALLTQPYQILIATPGRLLNLVEQDEIDLSELELVMIDEADRMLDMGQGPDVYALLDAIPDSFQAGLFSATLSGSGIERFAQRMLDDPTIIQVDAANHDSDQVQQLLYFADDREHKQTLLRTLLQDASCEKALVFCNKKSRAIELNDRLNTEGLASQVLHGDFIQAARLERVKRFSEHPKQVLVATDVAARGLDIANITHVINFDVPLRGDIYIHRIGRTGRAQQMGIAITLAEGHELKDIARIEYHLNKRLNITTMPGLEARLSLNKPTRAKKKPHKKKLAKKLAKQPAKKSSKRR